MVKAGRKIICNLCFFSPKGRYFNMPQLRELIFTKETEPQFLKKREAVFSDTFRHGYRHNQCGN